MRYVCTFSLSRYTPAAPPCQRAIAREGASARAQRVRSIYVRITMYDMYLLRAGVGGV